MNSVDTRSPFFPRSKSANSDIQSTRRANAAALNRNSTQRYKELEAKTSGDARVSIGESIKDFSRIKKAADSAPEIDNSEKMARLKAQIQNGTYQMDYDAMADKILATEY